MLYAKYPCKLGPDTGTDVRAASPNAEPYRGTLLIRKRLPAGSYNTG